MDEKTIQFLEEHIPDMAKASVDLAYWDALASGYHVFLVEDNHLVAMYADGSKKKIKPLKTTALRVRKGQKLRFK